MAILRISAGGRAVRQGASGIAPGTRSRGAPECPFTCGTLWRSGCFRAR
jgi:hypothetical protein